MCKKHVSTAGTNNYIPQYLWDVITCPALLSHVFYTVYPMKCVIIPTFFRVASLALTIVWFAPVPVNITALKRKCRFDKMYVIVRKYVKITTYRAVNDGNLSNDGISVLVCDVTSASRRITGHSVVCLIAGFQKPWRYYDKSERHG